MKFLKTIKALLPALFVLAGNVAAMAQNTASQPEMADVMRSNGKIYVVVAVLTIIFLGIIVYLISLNVKLNKIEKLMKHK